MLDLEAASKAAIKTGAQKLQKETRKELRQNLRPGSGRRLSKAVKVYSIRKTVGAKVVVNLPFAETLQRGATITGKSGNLVILLPSGEKLGFRRVNQRGLSSVLNDKPGQYAIVKAREGSGWVVLYKSDRGDRPTPIYALKPQVRVEKKMNFFENAEKISREIPQEIERLLKRSNFR